MRRDRYHNRLDWSLCRAIRTALRNCSEHCWNTTTNRHVLLPHNESFHPTTKYSSTPQILPHSQHAFNLFPTNTRYCSRKQKLTSARSRATWYMLSTHSTAEYFQRRTHTCDGGSIVQYSVGISHACYENMLIDRQIGLNLVYLPRHGIMLRYNSG